MKKLLLVISLVRFVFGTGTPFEDCGSPYSLDVLQLNDCVDVPCALFLGEWNNASFSVLPAFTSQNVSQTVFITINKVNNYIDPTPKPCTERFPCPITNNTKSVVTESSFYLDPDDLLPFQGTIQWSLTNEKNVQLVCFKTQVTLVDEYNYEY